MEKKTVCFPSSVAIYLQKDPETNVLFCFLSIHPGTYLQ